MVVSDSSIYIMVMPQPGGPGTSNKTFYASGVFHRKMCSEVANVLLRKFMQYSAPIGCNNALVGCNSSALNKVHASTIISLGNVFGIRFIVKV